MLILIMVNTVEPLYSKHLWNKWKCPDYRGVLIAGMDLYSMGHLQVSSMKGCPHFDCVLNRGVSL